MNAEVIAIGDELVSGERLDTNSQWISQRLGELGVRARLHTTVADDLDACSEAFRMATQRADLVVATGGLGPTADDLTRDAIAAAAGVPLELDEAALEAIVAMFQRRGRTMPQSNRRQALFPAGSRPIVNPYGTAPGIDVTVPRPGGACRLFALPGVPAELYKMWHAAVGPAIDVLRGAARVVCHRRIKCFGVGESELERRLPDLIRRGRDPQVGITVHDATITLRVTTDGPDRQACFAAMEPTIATIHESLGNLVFGEEDDELETAVSRLLVEGSTTLFTVEWGSAGLISAWLGALTLPQDVYVGGLSLRSADVAAQVLELPADWVGALGTVSQAVCETLAMRAREKFGVDLALAVSDFPTVTAAGPPPSFFAAVASGRGVASRSFPLAGHPAILRSLAAKRALNLLRLTLLPGGGGSDRDAG